MLAVLLLLTLALPFNASTVSATTPTAADTGNKTINMEKTDFNNNISNEATQKQSLRYGRESTTPAAGSTSTTTTIASTTTSSSESTVTTTGGATEVYPKVSLTYSQINTAATSVKNFIDTNGRLPNYVTISTYKITMPQFLQLLTENLLQLSSGTKNTITLLSVTGPTNSSGTLSSGNLYKTEYLNLAQQVINIIDSTGSAPDNINSSLGTISYENLIYSFSKVLNYYKSYGRLPNYVAVNSWTGSTLTEGGTNNTNSSISASLQQYLNPTTNCQSTNSAIIALANSLTAGKTTTYAKAVAIFNWVRDNISYSFYYNSVKGAVGTLNAKTANCCDTTHLLIALMRASGIPAKYMHGTCTFSSGTYGHVWAKVYVDGKWYNADAISSKNTFGVINNWNLNSYTLHGTYASLPF